MNTQRKRQPLANALLGILGGLFVVAGLGLASWLAVQTWGYASRLELLLGFFLLGSAAFGGFLILMGRGWEWHSPHRKHPHNRMS